ncbi:hypothetical protein [Ensifer sp. SL37]|uniref:hypothetical protein n=1 Tax=Ensifer sp. SL37 TaxID=2995137 RepID=UPI00227469A8|nr:hypothetical protein [Ensifer sp. SL37]MCY1740561.1 hypothetical protein [Ensifer sp. SL37]
MQSIRGEVRQLLSGMRREDLGDGFTPKLVKQWQKEMARAKGASGDLVREITTKLNSLQRGEPESPKSYDGNWVMTV